MSLGRNYETHKILFVQGGLPAMVHGFKQIFILAAGMGVMSNNRALRRIP